jgi:hypothetical protein
MKEDFIVSSRTEHEKFQYIIEYLITLNFLTFISNKFLLCRVIRFISLWAYEIISLFVDYFVVLTSMSGCYHQIGHYFLVSCSYVTQFTIIFTLLPTQYNGSRKNVVKHLSNEPRIILRNSC